MKSILTALLLTVPITAWAQPVPTIPIEQPIQRACQHLVTDPTVHPEQTIPEKMHDCTSQMRGYNLEGQAYLRDHWDALSPRARKFCLDNAMAGYNGMPEASAIGFYGDLAACAKRDGHYISENDTPTTQTVSPPQEAGCKTSALAQMAIGLGRSDLVTKGKNCH